MRILVTGASGFLGARLVRRLLARGHEVVGTGLEPWEGPVEVEMITIDLADRAALRDAVSRSRADRIVHLAALSHVGRSWSQMADYFQVNVLGTENLLDVADVPVVFASSSEVYGLVPDDEQPIRERRSAAPLNPYAMTKAAAERLVLRQGGIVARPFNMIGPGQASCFALPAFAEQLVAMARGSSESVLEVGNLEARRDFVHIDDGVEAFAVLVEKAEPGGIFNVATGEARSVRHALSLLLEVSGVDARVQVDPTRVRPVDVPVLAGDSSRLRALGWQPERDLATAVADLWAERSGTRTRGLEGSKA